MEQTRLVHRAKRGDTAAFGQLYREVYQDLYRFALYTLKHPQDAEDVVGDAVVDAWAQLASLRKETSFRAWIFRILSNKCRQKLKSYVQKTTELSEELPAPSSDAEEAADVRRVFARLDDEERLILSLHLFGGYTGREISELLGMNANTVRSKEKRALEKMERELTMSVENPQRDEKVIEFQAALGE